MPFALRFGRRRHRSDGGAVARPAQKRGRRRLEVAANVGAAKCESEAKKKGCRHSPLRIVAHYNRALEQRLMQRRHVLFAYFGIAFHRLGHRPIAEKVFD